MAELSYTAIASVDGYVNDVSGGFDWAAPDEEVHAFVNDLEREAGTALYGRRLYETMAVWDSWDVEGEPEVVRDYAALWRDTDKIVYSRTLDAVTTRRTRLERELDLAEVRRLKEEAERPLTVGGPGLAAQLLGARLVDEIRLFLVPWIVGGGTRAFPDGLRCPLELVDERRFAGGVAYLRYRVGGES